MSVSPSYLSPARLRMDLRIRDLSDPCDGAHAIQLLAGQAVDSLSRAWSCEVRWCRGPRIVPVADNYDHLGYSPGAALQQGGRTTASRGRQGNPIHPVRDRRPDAAQPFQRDGRAGPAAAGGAACR